jgi:hypothetical protein
MWGRRKDADDASAVKQTIVAGSPRALSTIEELRRQAEWDRLTEPERAALLAPLQGRQVPTLRTDGTPQEKGADRQLQDWVAQIVATRFQPETAGVVQSWLNDGAPDGHLYVGGQIGQGRTSLVAALARTTLAERSIPPEYCYAPDTTSLEQVTLLTLPRGTGREFGRGLITALGQLMQGWDGDSDSDSDSDPGNDGNAGAPSANSSSASGAAAPASDGAAAAATREAARRQLIAKSFDPFESASPDTARSYLRQLRTALEALAAGDKSLPFDSDEPPVGHVRPDPDELPDAPAGKGAPVVVASLGQVDLSDALLRANGGVLVLQAVDLLDASTWSTLAGALKAGGLSIKSGWPLLPLSTRVVMVGTSGAYDALVSNTEDFSRLFRYETWSNWDVPWSRETEAAYATLADGVSTRHGLPKFDAASAARLIEEGARRTDGLNRSRLSSNLIWLQDLAVEAGRLARTRGAAVTGSTDVESANERRRTLQSVPARRVREAILLGEEMTATAGVAIGQINGLGIYDVHPLEGIFAVPMRISASVSVGHDEQLLDIEREVAQADPSHVRGTMTMEGFLSSRYGQTRPISMVARIRFEQEHGGTGGDSASAAELFALLSALAQVPIRRSLAVTGAVGQYGEIQPIGGVNTKIEGFWELCRARRVQGEQPDGGYGVLIPSVNTRDLMLRPEVARSIAEEAWFHIWPISTVDEGLVLLTGLPAEEIHQRVDARLKRFHERAARSRGD